MSARPSVRKEQLLHTGLYFMKLEICSFFENLARKFKCNWKLTRIIGTLHANQYKILIISRWILLRMRYVAEKICRENQDTHMLCSITFSQKLCQLWDNAGKYSRAWQAIDDMVHAHCLLDILRLQTHTPGMYSTYCLFTASISARLEIRTANGFD